MIKMLPNIDKPRSLSRIALSAPPEIAQAFLAASAMKPGMRICIPVMNDKAGKGLIRWIMRQRKRVIRDTIEYIKGSDASEDPEVAGQDPDPLVGVFCSLQQVKGNWEVWLTKPKPMTTGFKVGSVDADPATYKSGSANELMGKVLATQRSVSARKKSVSKRKSK